MREFNFHLSRKEDNAVLEIVERAYPTIEKVEPSISKLEVVMDLTVCHNHACKLDLEGLKDASFADLMHDVTGIIRHLDRRTGQLTGCFMPRYAARNIVPS